MDAGSAVKAHKPEDTVGAHAALFGRTNRLAGASPVGRRMRSPTARTAPGVFCPHHPGTSRAGDDAAPGIDAATSSPCSR